MFIFPAGPYIEKPCVAMCLHTIELLRFVQLTCCFSFLLVRQPWITLVYWFSLNRRNSPGA